MTAAHFALMTVVALVGCSREAQGPMPAQPASVKLSLDAPVLVCWFVQSDPRGRSGYTVQDARISSFQPETWPLFSSPAELRRAILSNGFTNLPVQTLDSTNICKSDGWSWRALNLEELKELLH